MKILNIKKKKQVQVIGRFFLIFFVPVCLYFFVCFYVFSAFYYSKVDLQTDMENKWSDNSEVYKAASGNLDESLKIKKDNIKKVGGLLGESSFFVKYKLTARNKVYLTIEELKQGRISMLKKIPISVGIDSDGYDFVIIPPSEKVVLEKDFNIKNLDLIFNNNEVGYNYGDNKSVFDRYVNIVNAEGRQFKYKINGRVYLSMTPITSTTLMLPFFIFIAWIGFLKVCQESLKMYKEGIFK